MTVKSGALFAGGGLTIEGLKAAGHRVVWGVEYCPEISAVLTDNNPDTTVYVKPVQDCDPRTMEPVDELHMSPVCTRFSQANVGGVESSLDIDAAKGCCEFIKVMLPKSIILENVWGYRNSKSFAMILEVLHDKGYFVDFQHICAADFGGLTLCPLHANHAGRYWDLRIKAGIAGGVAMMQPNAQAQHLAISVMAHWVEGIRPGTAGNVIWSELENAARSQRIIQDGEVDAILTNAVMSVFGSTANTAGNIVLWLNSKLDALLLPMKWSTTSTETKLITVLKICECIAATASIPQIITPYDEQNVKCPLCKYSGVPQTRNRLILRASFHPLPMLTPTHCDLARMPSQGGLFDTAPLLPWNGWLGAIEDLVDGLPGSELAPWQLARLPKEYGDWLIGGGNTNMARTILIADRLGSQGKVLRLREPHEPSHTVTVTSAGHPTRALMIDGQPNHYGTTLTTREANDPMFTLQASQAKKPPRAVEHSSRTVKMTVQALARFQSMPDTYKHPDNVRLATKIIGNGVPCLLSQRIAENMREIASA